MKTKIALLFTLLFIGKITFSQQEINTQKRRVILTENTSGFATTSNTAELSEYYGLEQNIAKISVGDKIPTNFPKRQLSGQTKNEYITLVNAWIINNPAAIKPEYQNTKITE